MTLSERLAAAARARNGHVDEVRAPARSAPQPATAAVGSSLAAPTRAAAPPPAPSAPATPVPGQRIIAGASTPVVAVDPDPEASATSVCPTCGRTGVLGVVDLAGRTADWSCLSCGTLWQVSLDEQRGA